MKKGIYIMVLSLLGSVLWSCSLDDYEGPRVVYEQMPIDSVQIPDTLVYGNTYEVDLSYRKTTTCHNFYRIEYQSAGNQRYVAIINAVFDDQDCEEQEKESTTTFNLNVQQKETYIFNFWQGIDQEGENVYLVKEIPVKME